MRRHLPTVRQPRHCPRVRRVPRRSAPISIVAPPLQCVLGKTALPPLQTPPPLQEGQTDACLGLGGRKGRGRGRRGLVQSKSRMDHVLLRRQTAMPAICSPSRKPVRPSPALGGGKHDTWPAQERVGAEVKSTLFGSKRSSGLGCFDLFARLCVSALKNILVIRGRENVLSLRCPCSGPRTT